MVRAVYYARADGLPDAAIDDLFTVAQAVFADASLMPLRAGVQSIHAMPQDPARLPDGICARLYQAMSPHVRAEAESLREAGAVVHFLSEVSGTTKRLEGMRVLTTRAREQTERLMALLRLHGAEPCVLPAIRYAPPEDRTSLEAAIREVTNCRYAVFTSATGVRSFLAEMRAAGHDAGRLGLRLYAVGPATAAAVAGEGLRSEALPVRQRAEGLAQLLRERAAPDERGLIVGPESSDTALLRSLQKNGLQVRPVGAYRTVSGVDQAAAAAVLEAPPPQAALFYSPSAVRGTLSALPQEFLRQGRIIAVGPTTAAALRESGLSPDAIATEPSDAAVVEALCDIVQHPKREEG